MLFARDDGWGIQQVDDVSRSGLVEIMVWCKFLVPTLFESNITLGPGVRDELLEIHFPHEIKSVNDLFVSVLVSISV